MIVEEPIRLNDLKPGDRVQGFKEWDCIPETATRIVKLSEDGHLYISCSEGRHYLDGQIEDDDGILYGMRRVSKNRRK